MTSGKVKIEHYSGAISIIQWNRSIHVFDATDPDEPPIPGAEVSIVESAADANDDSAVDIIDALLIARYYVGLIEGFCRQNFLNKTPLPH